MLRSELLDLWNQTQMGPLVDSVEAYKAFLRLPNNTTIFEKYLDPAAGPRTPHLMISIEVGPENFSNSRASYI